jgi:hypothetical protein
MKKYLLFLLSFFLFISCEKAIESTDVEEYLLGNKSEILPDNINNTAKLFLPTDFSSNSMFLVGEYHGTVANRTVDLHFLKLFKQQADFQYLFLEFGYGGAKLFNDYFVTGDDGILTTIFNAAKGSPYPTQENKFFWRQARDYWLSLPPQKRFKVVGADVEHQPSLAMISLKKVVGTKTDVISQTIRNKSSYDYKSVSDKEWASGLLKTLKDNSQIFTKEEFFDIDFILQNLMNTNEVYANINDFNTREERIYSNAKGLLTFLPAGKYYGMWGSAHVYQKSNRLTLSNLLQYDEQSIIKNKVLSIVVFYENCKSLASNGTESLIEPLPSDAVVFSKLAQTDMTLFKLNNEGSPFKKGLLFEFDRSDKGVTTDYFNYMILMKNSSAMRF